MRRSRAIAAVVVAVTLLVGGGPSLLFSLRRRQWCRNRTTAPRRIVTFADSDSGFWPSLNAGQTYETRSPSMGSR